MVSLAQHGDGDAAPGPSAPDLSDVSFGDFLRSRRERLTPEAAGLPAGGRRRTPGLRREELALLAGISVDYLTRLEQGRETNPSSDVLESLGRVLQLDIHEWHHLFDLLGAKRPEKCAGTLPDTPIEENTRALLDRLEPTPAFVLEQTADVTAWNEAYRRLMEPTGLFDLDPPNLLRYTFLVPEARSLFREWAAVAAEQVGNLRVAAARRPYDRTFRELVGELAMACPDFTELWSVYDVQEKMRGRKHLDHPVVGELTLDFEAMLLPGCQQRSLVTYLPVSEADDRALEQLPAVGKGTPAPGRLRALPS